jgi:hypothetical protein
MIDVIISGIAALSIVICVEIAIYWILGGGKW